MNIQNISLNNLDFYVLIVSNSRIIFLNVVGLNELTFQRSVSTLIFFPTKLNYYLKKLFQAF